jgi:hypothetical protein
MIKALGTFVTLMTGAALLTANVNFPGGNETFRILGGAILLSLGLIYSFSEVKEWMKTRQLTKQS